MAWSSGSSIFRFFIAEALANNAAYDLSGASVDTFKAALYNSTGTPDKDAATAVLTGYNGAASAWVVANEVSHVSHWPVGGQPLVSPAISVVAGGIVMFDVNDTASIDAATTLSGVVGTLVYDDTLASKPGVSFNYFGGSQSVTAGTFTVVWHANGVFRLTMA